jgi:hypothetical protein
MAARGLCWSAVVAALAVVVVAGAAAAPVKAEQHGDIVFTSGDEGAGFTIASIGAGFGESIEVDLVPDVALPRKLVLEVPSGYGLDLSAKPGTTIAEASLSLVAVDSPSFAHATNDLVAKDPASYVSDEVAQACAPGVHAAVWAASFSLAGQDANLTIFVDPGKEAGVGYVLQACPTGLAGSTGKSSAAISIDGLDGLTDPSADGRYVWRAVVAPKTAPTYELQALVPLPESISLHARYERKSKTVVLTGRMIEAGLPVANAELYFTKTVGSDSYDGFAETRTRTDGTYSFKARTLRTADFAVTARSTVGPCSTPSTAPAGCLASTTVPPDSASTTVWVSVRGGAVRSYRRADQRRAETENLASSDFPSGFDVLPGGADNCANQGHESDLTITGENSSPSFFNLEHDDSLRGVEATGLARVYATRSQAQQALKREARLHTVRCELKGLGINAPPIRPIRLPAPSCPCPRISRHV